MQDALTTATDKKSYVREVDGQAFYTYEVAGTVRPLPPALLLPDTTGVAAQQACPCWAQGLLRLLGCRVPGAAPATCCARRTSTTLPPSP